MRHERSDGGGVRLRVGDERVVVRVSGGERSPEIDGVGGSIPGGGVDVGVVVVFLVVAEALAASSIAPLKLSFGQRRDEIGVGSQRRGSPRGDVGVERGSHLGGAAGFDAVPHERLHGEGRRDDARVQGFAKERVRLVQHPGGAEGVEEPRDQRGLLPEGRAEATRGGARGGERAEDGARFSPQLRGAVRPAAVLGPTAGGGGALGAGNLPSLIGFRFPPRPRGWGGTRRPARVPPARDVRDLSITPSLRPVAVVAVGVRPGRREGRAGGPTPSPTTARRAHPSRETWPRNRRESPSWHRTSVPITPLTAARRPTPGPGPSADSSIQPAPRRESEGGHV